MTDLGQERGDAFGCVDTMARHGGVQCGNKNARLGAGVGQDVDELLLRKVHVQVIASA
ncbi:hypothetical protein D3C78_834250 [compost metagenome]